MNKFLTLLKNIFGPKKDINEMIKESQENIIDLDRRDGGYASVDRKKALNKNAKAIKSMTMPKNNVINMKRRKNKF